MKGSALSATCDRFTAFGLEFFEPHLRYELLWVSGFAMMLPGPGLAKRLGLDIGVKNSSGSTRGTNLVKVITTLTVGTTGIATYMNGEHDQ